MLGVIYAVSSEDALYPFTSRGNEKKPVFKDDHDRDHILDTLQHVNKHYNWIYHVYCLMTNTFTVAGEALRH